MRRQGRVWLSAVFIVAGLALSALIAVVVTRPKPASLPTRPAVRLTSCETTNDSLALWVSRATFMMHDGKSHIVPLGLALGNPPAPESDWSLAEVNPSPGANYCILKNRKTRERAVVWQDGDTPQAIRAPIPFPLPPWPGVGCVGVLPTGRTALGQSELMADLTGGAYTQDALLGQFRAGDKLPKPWDHWRVKELILNLTPPPGRIRPGDKGEFACIIANEDTGRAVRLPAKQMIDLPHDAPLVTPATTQPSGSS